MKDVASIDISEETSFDTGGGEEFWYSFRTYKTTKQKFDFVHALPFNSLQGKRIIIPEFYEKEDLLWLAQRGVIRLPLPYYRFTPLAKVKAFWANADIIVLSEQSAERLKNGIVDICGDECDMYFKTSPNTLFITKEDFLAGNYKLTNQPKKIVCDVKSFYLPDMSTNDIKTYNATKKLLEKKGGILKKSFSGAVDYVIYQNPTKVKNRFETDKLEKCLDEICTKGLKTNILTLDKFLEESEQLENNEKETIQGIFTGKSFVLVNYQEYRTARNYLVKLIEENGGTIRKRTSGSTSFLIYKEHASFVLESGETVILSEMRKALEFNEAGQKIQIFEEADFLKYFNELMSTANGNDIKKDYNGKFFVLTGFTEQQKAEMTAIIEKAGGIVKSSVVSGTRYLIYNPEYGRTTTKYLKAKEMQENGMEITILTEEEFFGLFK